MIIQGDLVRIQTGLPPSPYYNSVMSKKAFENPMFVTGLIFRYDQKLYAKVLNADKKLIDVYIEHLEKI